MANETSGTASKDASGGLGRFNAVVRSALRSSGLSSETSTKYAWFCTEIYRYILAHPKTMAALKNVKDAREVFENSNKAFKAAKLIQRGAALGLSSAKPGLTMYSATAGANVLHVFVERFEKLAQTQGIELNECSMAIVRVSLDIATAGAASVTALSGFGLVLAAVQIVEGAKDSYALGQVCFAGK